MQLNRKRLPLKNYFEWRSGNLATLLNVAPTQVNGLALVPYANISTEFNYFAAVSRFYSDAMLGDIPDLAAMQLDLLTQLTSHWAVAGEACIAVSSNGQARAIRPDYVFPIPDEYDADTIKGYVFVFPYLPTMQTGDVAVHYANRARVVEYDVASRTATSGIREYRDGWIADLPKGEPAGLTDVLYISGEDSVYGDISGIVREIILRLNIMQVALNSTSFPILQIDTDLVGDGELQSGITQSRLNAVIRGGLGLTVPPPFIGESSAQYIERTGTGLSESLSYIRLLLGQLGVLSGVPDYVFGVQLDRPAAQTERVLFAGQARVNRFRRDVENAYGVMGYDLHFTNEPFSTRTERVNALVKQFEKGVIDRNEVRRGLGYGVVRRLFGRG